MTPVLCTCFLIQCSLNSHNKPVGKVQGGTCLFKEENGGPKRLSLLKTHSINDELLRFKPRSFWLKKSVIFIIKILPARKKSMRGKPVLFDRENDALGTDAEL